LWVPQDGAIRAEPSCAPLGPDQIAVATTVRDPLYLLPGPANGQRSPAAAHDCTGGRLVQRVLGTHPHNLPWSQCRQRGEHLSDEWLKRCVLIALRDEHNHRDVEFVDVLLK
jgi:hypothetical protein